MNFKVNSWKNTKCKLIFWFGVILMLTQFSPKLKYLELVWPWPSYYQNEISWSYYWYLPSHRIKKMIFWKMWTLDCKQTNKLITYFLPSGRATSNFKYSPCPSGVVALSECSCFLSVFRLQRWGEFRGRPSYWHHHSPRHVEQSSLQVLQDQHDPQTAFHHRCPARYKLLDARYPLTSCSQYFFN